ncbi:ABC transporter permease [Pelagovum pacificum]|uniref:ABC transporter permease n=1 Tax=Pelagovum pacificum TaxID=2588711 RepID=A0A5C5GF98_9RHOB|nr:ABC transporter permease [Pelagovum pacificum]QQA44237.1 ABC transporter permease [Pelagovum pacificum]TNY32641.1 ABC transporter permease [Pelagovum pacificum]
MTDVTTQVETPVVAPHQRQRSPLWFAWQRFLSNKAAVAGGAVLSVLILMAIFAPLITPVPPTAQSFLTESLAFPSSEHWFGVDNLGRDFYTRIVYGARVSLSIGFIAAAFSVLIGIPLGALAGFFGGTVDWVIMRIIELFSVVPPLLAAMLLGALSGGGYPTIVAIAALFGWVQVCLLVRAQVKALREKEFVRAAQALGASPGYIIRRHLIMNSVSPIIVGFVLAIPLAMMLEASLSFLGIGVPPPTPTWGQMISEGIDYMFFYWHLAVFPTAALAITVLATSLFGDGLRDALDPTLKGR